MTRIFIFFLSIYSSVTLLVLERIAGIPWDFHPDSATYIDSSAAISEDLISGDIRNIFNNGFYFIVNFLGNDVASVITFNIILFSLTNVLIYKFLAKHTDRPYLYLGIFLLLLNPYRLHLSTTCLKDTTIIFLSVLSVYNSKSLILTLPSLLIMRTGSVLYFFVFVSQKLKAQHLVYLFIPGIFLLYGLYHQGLLQYLADWALRINQTNMVFREFDTVPTFQEYGIYGIFLRAILWPFFYLSGLFFILSPAPAYFPIFLGSIFNLLYCRLYLKSWGFLLIPYVALMLVCFFVSGFTSFLRYATPISTIIPLIIASQIVLPFTNGQFNILLSLSHSRYSRRL